VDRADFLKFSLWRFLKVNLWGSPYSDEALSIGYEQTCSQPSMVAFMCDVLDLKEGMNVLEIGSGCGYHAAVTSHIISQSGFLTTLEYIPQLVNMAEKNLRRHFGHGLDERLKVVNGDGSIGFRQNSLYDRIYLTAGVKLGHFDHSILVAQLNPENGILLFPQESGSLFREIYENGSIVSEDAYAGICFVPLKGKNSWWSD